MESIISSKKECYKCKTTQYLQTHHILHGTANRKLSEQYGLKVFLCCWHHNITPDGVHFDKEFDLRLKILAQAKFEETHSRVEFTAIFGINYI